MASKKGQSICIFSAKGGVGKTTTALNLAGIYQTINKKVLIIDLDLSSGGISLALNKTVNKSLYNFAIDIENNNYNSLSEYVTKYNDFIDFLAAPIDPRQTSFLRANYLDVILDRSLYAYDVVIIDTNHIINELNLSIIEKVNKILFITTNDPYDLKNMRSLISIFKDYGLNNYKFLLNCSRDPFKNYYSLEDIENVIKTKINYILSNNFYIKNIDEYIIDGKILTLDKKIINGNPKDYTTLIELATDLINKEDSDEK